MTTFERPQRPRSRIRLHPLFAWIKHPFAYRTSGESPKPGFSAESAASPADESRCSTRTSPPRSADEVAIQAVASRMNLVNGPADRISHPHSANTGGRPAPEMRLPEMKEPETSSASPPVAAAVEVGRTSGSSDVHAAGFAGDNWRVVGVSMSGTAHVKSNTPRQDRMRFDVRDGTLVVAVSDGAGSAELSSVGAEVAVSVAVESVFETLARLGPRTNLAAFDRDYPQALRLLFENATIRRVRAALEQEARRRDVPMRALACTLTLTAIQSESTLTLQVGDSFSVASGHRASEFGYELTAGIHKGEYANETRFLTDNDILSQFSVSAFWCAASFVAVASDGLAPLCLENGLGEAHPTFFERLDAFCRDEARDDPDRSFPREPARLAEELTEWLGSAEVCERTDDDKTLVIATRRRALGSRKVASSRKHEVRSDVPDRSKESEGSHFRAASLGEEVPAVHPFTDRSPSAGAEAEPCTNDPDVIFLAGEGDRS